MGIMIITIKYQVLDTGLIYALALGVVNMDMGFISPELQVYI